MNEGIPSIESKPELSPETKLNVANAWSDMITDTSVPEGVEDMTPDELKEWFFGSLMEGVADFVETENLKIDESLIENIQSADSVDDKSSAELNYLKAVQKEVERYAMEFFLRKEPTKWNSWPKLMKETKSFNCAGAVMVGTHFLQKAGIKSFIGNPIHHVVNVVELSDGRTVYADLIHGEDTVHEVTEETKIANTRTLKVSNPNVDYELVPVFELEELPSIVLGNMGSIGKAENKEVEDTINRERAKKYRERYSKHFDAVNFSELDKALYPESVQIFNSDEMRNESKMIDVVRSASNILRSKLGEFSVEQRSEIRLEFKTNKDLIIKSVLERDLSYIEDLSPDLVGIIKEVLEKINEIENSHPQFLQKTIDAFNSKIKLLA